jgi:hypothetical protein
MDERTFDDVVRRWSMAGSRRGVLKSAFISTLAGIGVASLLDAEDAKAKKSCKKKCKKKNPKDARKRCKRKCKKNVCKPKPPEAVCVSDEECCPNETKYTCGLSHNSGLDTVCCGTQGATCSTTFQCCLTFNCVGGQCVSMAI